MSEALLNVIFFFTNFLFVTVIFHRFLLTSLKTAFAALWPTLRSALLGFLLYYGISILVTNFIFWVSPDFANVNDVTIEEMTQEYYSLIAICTIFLVPVVEETFYRGLVFQGLQRKHRFLAYVVSTLVFSVVHIIGYIGLTDWLTLLLCFVQYLPAGIALAWTYEKADTIIAPILIHITINQIGMSAMR